MDNEIKVGDIVRVSEDIPQFYRRCNSMRMLEQTFRVVGIEDGLALLVSTSIIMYKVMLPAKYLIKVNAKPKYSEGDKVRIIGSNILTNKMYTVSDRRYFKQEWFYSLGDTPWIGESCLKPYTEPKESVENLKKREE